MTPAPRRRRHSVIQIDTCTGAEQRLPNLFHPSSTGYLFTEAEAFEAVEWRTDNLSPRYRYRIEPPTDP